MDAPPRQRVLLDLHRVRIDARDAIPAEIHVPRDTFRVDLNAVRISGRAWRLRELHLARLGVEAADGAGLDGEPHHALRIDDRRVRAAESFGHCVFGDLACLRIEHTDVVPPHAREPDVAGFVVNQPVRARTIGQRELLHVTRLEIEPPEPVSVHAGPPERSILRGEVDRVAGSRVSAQAIP